MAEKTKIKLVVYNNHTLGYIDPSVPDYVYHLRASILKGAVFSMSKTHDLIHKNDSIRLASAKDFEDYRCSFEGYETDPLFDYEFAK